MASASAPRSSASRISISGTSVASAPRRSSSLASDFASGRVTTMRRPASGWSATNRRKYAVCAGSECVLREPLAELVGLSFPCTRTIRTSIDRCDEPLETYTRGRRGSREPRPSRAAGSEGAQATRSAVVSARAAGSSSATSRARMASSSTRHWIASALARSGQHGLGREPLRHLVLQAEPTNARGGEHSRIELAHGDPRSACRRSPDRAGSRDHREVPSPGQRAAGCSSRRRRLPKGVQRAAVARNQAIPHVLAPCHRADDDAGRVLGRQVLERVNREVDLAVAERRSRSPVKSPLPPISGKRLAARLRPVAGGSDHARFAGEIRPRPLVSSPMTRSVWTRASVEARVPRMTAACRGGALTDRSGRRGRTGRAWRRRSRPRSRSRLARVRGRSGRGEAS